MIRDEDLQENAARVSAHMLNRLRDLRHPLLVDVRANGLFFGAEFQINGAPATRFAADLVESMVRKGFLTNVIGAGRHILKIRPPMPFQYRECRHADGCADPQFARNPGTRMIETLAQEAAAHWGGTPLRLIRNRENAVFEMALARRRHAPPCACTGRAISPMPRSGPSCGGAPHLAARGVNVPAALPARRRRLCWSPCPMAAPPAPSTWIDGEPLGEAGVPFATPLPQLLDQHHRHLGQLIRDLHDTTATLTLPEGFQRPRWDLDGLTGEAPFWGRFWDHPAATSGPARHPDPRPPWLARTAGGHAGTVQLIHADVLRENVLVNDRSVYLIDFDDSGFGFPLYDLGTTLSQNLYEPAYPDIRDALMAGYGTTDTDMVETDDAGPHLRFGRLDDAASCG